MKFQLPTIAAAAALLGALPAAAVVPGFAGNITGGGSSTPVVVSTLAQAQTAVNNLSSSGSLVLHYNGTFDEQAILNNICGQWSKPAQELSISGKNNITILGLDGSKANFGIRIKGTSNNIIVRNMKIGLLPGGASNGDLIGIEANSHHVWIDHNELYTRNMKCEGTPDDDTTFDGMLDIKNSASFITVSYNYMHDHAKVGLIGSSDTDSAERRVTYAHNRYENLGSRLPFQRFGYVHSYNNYFNNITGSGINPRMGGFILVENNFFENALNPVFSQSTILGRWDLRNNNTRSAADNATYNIRWTACSGSTPCQKATDWQSNGTFPITLPYSYTVYPPATSKCIALAAAGAGKGLREAADVLGSCGGTNNLTLGSSSLSLGSGVSSSSVSVTANVAWTVTDDQSWLSTTPTSGSNNGNFAVNATANTGTAGRNGTVTVAGGGITRTVAVAQAGTATTTSVYQTENGTVGGGTVLESSNGGFNGTGYVNASATGGFSQISNVSGLGGGSKTLRIRYALGVTAARTGRLLVNGVASNITFNGTGAWTTWALQNVTVTLNNNSTNTIRFESTGQDLANIDQVEVL
ncbi:MAG TPA: BACON domain-containing carbohydrate-binding protein [Steroidobacteraceae bacterium]|nr:BACON domain-containing carbohydrate-binding protein [Steroidobacteraceae bacterium]